MAELRTFWANPRGAAAIGILIVFAGIASTSIASIDTAQAGGLLGARAAQPAAAIASAVRVESDPSNTRIVFDLNAPALPQSFVLADPDRAIIDLPQVDFRIDPAAGRQPSGRGKNARRFGLASSFRFGLLSPGRSRIVVDLANPAKVSTSTPRKVGDHYELVVALSRADRTAFRAAARVGNAAPPAAAAVVPVTAPTEKPVIVIDPGHGGPDNGAVVNSVIEKDVTLAFAKKLAARLEGQGAFKVVMTRSTDVFVPLGDRVSIARAAGAALMVSVHADKLTGPEATEVSGATVYTVSDRASDAYAAKVAAKENQADAAAGVEGRADTADVNDILFDLTRKETRAYSHVFARTLVNYWKIAGRLNHNPQRAAGFVVLKAPDVPSVLLELGYLSSPTDSADLTSESWRDQASGRMAEAIESYFSDRHGPAKASAGVPMPLKEAAITRAGSR